VSILSFKVSKVENGFIVDSILTDKIFVVEGHHYGKLVELLEQLMSCGECEHVWCEIYDLNKVPAIKFDELICRKCKKEKKLNSKSQ